MKILLATTILTIYSLNLQAQTFVDFFDMGTEEFNKGNLQNSDSLYTLSINALPNINAYFNRGMVRKILHDTCGFCEDMKTAYLYFSDEDALTQFGNNCINNSDTVFFSRKFIPAGKTSKPRYYDVTFDDRCSLKRLGLIFDNNKKYNYLVLPPSSTKSIYNLKLSEINVYAQYYLLDSTRIYTSFINKPNPDFRGRKEYLLKKQIRELIIKDPLKLSEFEDENIYLITIINTNGKVTDIKLGSEEIIDKNQFDLISDSTKVLLIQNYKYPIGKIFKEPVSYECVQRF